MPPNPDLALFDPGKAEIGRRRRSHAAGARLWRAPPPPRAMLNLIHPIQNQRSRLDRSFIRSKPLDPDPAAHVRGYRFGLNFLLKSPWLFPDSTRGPEIFKNNYAEVLFLAFDPLSFFNFEPAVHPWQFYALTPETKV